MHPVTLAAFLALGLLEPTPGLGKFIFDAAHFQNLPPVDSQNLEPRYLTNEGVQLSLKERDSICDVEPYDPQPLQATASGEFRFLVSFSLIACPPCVNVIAGLCMKTG